MFECESNDIFGVHTFEPNGDLCSCGQLATIEIMGSVFCTLCAFEVLQSDTLKHENAQAQSFANIC
jgi:hypothetical protein